MMATTITIAYNTAIIVAIIIKSESSNLTRTGLTIFTPIIKSVPRIKVRIAFGFSVNQGIRGKDKERGRTMNRKSEETKEKQISEVMASIENRVRHAYNQG